MTFSIVARCKETLALGVCVSTANPNVRERVPFAEKDVGAIATQGMTYTFYGREGLKLLKKGFSPQQALELMLSKDQEKENRQVIIIDKDGNTAAFTGKKTGDWKGHLIGSDYIVAGNLLAGQQVIKEMAKVFENSKGNLEYRLIVALEAGKNVGGDKRGEVSAALIVTPNLKKEIGLDIRIDNHIDPIGELKKLVEQRNL